MGRNQEDQNSQQNEGKNSEMGKREEFNFFVIRDNRPGDEKDTHFKNDELVKSQKTTLFRN
jgi:hypothetical protein